MSSSIDHSIGKYAGAHSAKRKWKRTAAVLSVVVGFLTVYALIMPATTMEGKTFCGLEEHVHTDECYASRTLICTLSEEGHTHTEECYKDELTQICGRTESVGHTHGPDCYAETDTLVCTLPPEGHTHGPDCYTERDVIVCGKTESEGHTHGAGCYTDVTTLICDQDGVEGHVHGENCYRHESLLTCALSESAGHTHGPECHQRESVLTCTLPECDPHTHDENCFVRETVLICEQEECAPHSHDENCFEVTRTLICGLEEQEPHEHTDECWQVNDGASEEPVCGKKEHEHTLQCHSDPNADRESEEYWKKTFADVELTGKWNEDVLAIAETQLGYYQSARNYQVLDDGVTVKGYTRYGAWYGLPYGDWCAMFCSFCIHYAEVDSELMPIDCSCGNWIDGLKEKGLYHDAEDYTPLPGDLIFFDFDGNRNSEHVGFVTEVTDEGRILTIEGNVGGSVREQSYTPDNKGILGFASLPENKAPSAAGEERSRGMLKTALGSVSSTARTTDPAYANVAAVNGKVTALLPTVSRTETADPIESAPIPSVAPPVRSEGVVSTLPVVTETLPAVGEDVGTVCTVDPEPIPLAAQSAEGEIRALPLLVSPEAARIDETLVAAVMAAFLLIPALPLLLSADRRKSVKRRKKAAAMEDYLSAVGHGDKA